MLMELLLERVEKESLWITTLEVLTLLTSPAPCKTVNLIFNDNILLVGRQQWLWCVDPNSV